MTCKICGEDKFLSDFPKLNNEGICKSCIYSASRKRTMFRKMYKRKPLVGTTKVCSTCGKELDLSCFSPSTRSPDGYMDYCTACTRFNQDRVCSCCGKGRSKASFPKGKKTNVCIKCMKQKAEIRAEEKRAEKRRKKEKTEKVDINYKKCRS